MICAKRVNTGTHQSQQTKLGMAGSMLPWKRKAQNE